MQYVQLLEKFVVQSLYHLHHKASIYRLFSALKMVFSLENLRVLWVVYWKQASLSLVFIYWTILCFDKIALSFKIWQHARPHAVCH